MTPAATRAAALVEFRARAAAIFHAQPEMRSVMLALAQYPDDGVDDEVHPLEVHTLLIVSPRDTPVWPHWCGARWAICWPTPGEECSDCRNHGARFRVDNAAFEPFCHEYNAVVTGKSFLPFAIARRAAGDAIGLEIVGKVVRSESDVICEPRERDLSWLALPRARELYELVCVQPADDGPRRVLADYLLEHEHPYGEYIALALAGDLDAAAIARRDALLAAHGRSWLGGLADVIPDFGARWERGFLARADAVWYGDHARESSVAAWGTVETIRFRGSGIANPLQLEMVALRDVGPMSSGIEGLAAAPRPWAIERLHAVLDRRALLDVLWRTTTLPRLTHLVLDGQLVTDALERPRPAWWQQLERLTLRTCSMALRTFFARTAGIAPWVAISYPSFTNESGWEVATGPAGQIELSLAGWHDMMSPRLLAELIAGLPRDADVALAPSPYWTPLLEDAERISAQARRPVRVKS